jgi:hypothetical protein
MVDFSEDPQTLYQAWKRPNRFTEPSLALTMLRAFCAMGGGPGPAVPPAPSAAVEQEPDRFIQGPQFSRTRDQLATSGRGAGVSTDVGGA